MDESSPDHAPPASDEVGKLAIRLLRELAEYDPEVAQRMRELGLAPETKP